MPEIRANTVLPAERRPVTLETADGITLDEIQALARTEALDAWLKPLEMGLADLPQMAATVDGAVRLRHGNPGSVVGPALPYGSEAWASYQGRAVAFGIYRGGELHPTRVFVDPA